MHLVARPLKQDDIESVLRICWPGSDTDREMAQKIRDDWDSFWKNGVNLGVAQPCTLTSPSGATVTFNAYGAT